jgi:hypothetical protein
MDNVQKVNNCRYVLHHIMSATCIYFISSCMLSEYGEIFRSADVVILVTFRRCLVQILVGTLAIVAVFYFLFFFIFLSQSRQLQRDYYETGDNHFLSSPLCFTCIVITLLPFSIKLYKQLNH